MLVKEIISFFDRAEKKNAVGKGEHAGFQHFLHFPVFSKAFFFKVVKSRDCVASGIKHHSIH